MGDHGGVSCRAEDEYSLLQGSNLQTRDQDNADDEKPQRAECRSIRNGDPKVRDCRNEREDGIAQQKPHADADEELLKERP